MQQCLKFLVIFALAATPALAQRITPLPMYAPKPAAPPAGKSFTAGVNQMQDSMSSAPITNDADRDFVVLLIPYHQGATAIAMTELQYGRDPVLRSLAKSMIAAQAKYIAQIKAWQASHPTS